MAPAFGGQVPVCMQCGGREIRPQSLSEGLWAAGGEGVAWTCDDCHHLGPPFLLEPGAARMIDGPGHGDPDDPAWHHEYQDAALEADDDRWHERARVPPSRLVSYVFVGLGILFLLPPALTVQDAVFHGSAWGLVRGLVGTGWLLAIGLALLVVGWRRLQPAAAPEATPTDPKLGEV